MKITSLTNQKVKDLAKLKDKKYRYETMTYLVEGENLVEEAKKAGIVLETISQTEEYRADLYVTKDVMEKICDTSSAPKVAAVCKIKELGELGQKIVVLEGIQDPGNLGTIVRSAAAFGYDVVLHKCTDLYSPKVVRSTQGNIYKIAIKEVENLVEFLKNENYYIYTTRVTGGKEIANVNKKDKMAIVIGSEGNGVTDKMIESADEFVYIPMINGVESLNAGVAASIIMERLR